MLGLFSHINEARQRGLPIEFTALMCGATSTVFTKYFLNYFSPYTLSAITQALSAVVILLFLGLVPEFKKLKMLTLREIGALLVVAVLSSVIAPLFWLNGLQRTTAADATLIDCLLPIFAIIIASLWLKEKVSRQQKIGIAVMFVGVASIATKGFIEGVSLTNGSVYIVLSGLCWAFAEVVFKRFLQHSSPELMVLIRNIIGAITLLFVVPRVFHIEHDFTAFYDLRIVGLFAIFSLVSVRSSAFIILFSFYGFVDTVYPLPVNVVTAASLAELLEPLLAKLKFSVTTLFGATVAKLIKNESIIAVFHELST